MRKPHRLRLPEVQSAAHAFRHRQYRDRLLCDGRKEPLDHKYLDHLSDLLSIRGRLDHRPSELSGGEQQRVAIARALITHPAIVLADEPTGNLDTKNSEVVLDMLVRSNRELRQTVLMITHNPDAAQVAGRILHMRDGEIVKIEKGPESRRRNRSLVAARPLTV